MHIVASSVAKHFTMLDILYDLQHGFREKRSCETQLIMLVDELAKNMQMGKHTDLILLDLSKAFDKVAHEKLLLKLHQYGIRGDTLNCIKDFLDNRKQTVLINGINSDEVPGSSGVRHGSVLDPILFLAYINDLPEQVKSRVILFTDDTAIYLAISSTITCRNLYSFVVYLYVNDQLDQLPRLGKRELICLLLYTYNYVVSVWRGFLFLWVFGMGYVILF